MRGRLLLAVGAAAVVGLTATAVLVVARRGGEGPAPAVAGAPAIAAPRARRAAPPRPLRTRACAAGATVALGSPRLAYAGTVVAHATAFRHPGRGAFARFGHLNVNGVPTVLGILGARLDRTCRASWYRVQLPLRPNGVTGWVRARSVAARPVRARIVVDLSERRVTLFRRGLPVLIATAAIGSPSTPTPTGRYYVDQKLVAPDPLGPFGPAALGISAYSPVLQSWAQGGPIAIHGTNEAGLLGGAVSHGCVRVSNADVMRLWRLAPTGTPVLIRM